jgi:hypothetical protein
MVIHAGLPFTMSGPRLEIGRPEDPPGFIGNGASHQSKSDSTSSVSTQS